MYFIYTISNISRFSSYNISSTVERFHSKFLKNIQSHYTIVHSVKYSEYMMEDVKGKKIKFD